MTFRENITPVVGSKDAGHPVCAQSTVFLQIDIMFYILSELICILNAVGSNFRTMQRIAFVTLACN